MCFRVTVFSKLLINTLKCCQLIQQSLLAAEFRVFGDNSAAEFHKLCRGIWQNFPQIDRCPVD